MTSPQGSPLPRELAAAIEQCGREPIHIPGKIQSHGIFFALDEHLVVIRVSANAAALVGRPPEELLGKAILDLVEPDAAPAVEKLIREAASSFVNPFRIPVKVAGARVEFDGIAHLVEGLGTVLEMERDPAPDAEKLKVESLDNYLQIVQRSLGQITNVSDPKGISDVIVREVKDFTGFDRVMVYQFAPDGHGHVISEAVEEGMEPYLDLHYPASDIPPQARALYLKNPVRLLQDVEAETSAILPETSQPVDLSRSVLRAMSPVHVQYLKNMGVAASLSASLVVDGKLWGLVACHHRQPRFVSYGIRATISLYCLVLAAQLNEKQQGKRNEEIAAARRIALSIMASLRDLDEPLAGLPGTLPQFLRLFEADGAALIAEDEIYRHGITPAEPVIQQLRGELGDGSDGGVIITSRSGERFESLRAIPVTAAGIVAIHLGYREWLVLFRGEVSQQVLWAGNPDEAKSVGDRGQLNPRTSFAAWLQEIKGVSKPWPGYISTLTTEVQAGILEILRARNVQLARANQDLRRFAGVVAHEVNNHLHTAIMTLSLLKAHLNASSPATVFELAANGSTRLSELSTFTKHMLAFAGSESTLPAEAIDLDVVAGEVVKDLTLSLNHPEVSIEIGHLPRIEGKPPEIRHLLSNLVRNALIHGRSPERKLSISIGHRSDPDAEVIYVRDDGRGIPSEHKRRIFEYFYRGSSGASGSGIGLAFCAQVVERMGQRLWVEDSPGGQGSTFCFSVSAV